MEILQSSLQSAFESVDLSSNKTLHKRISSPVDRVIEIDGYLEPHRQVLEARY